MKRVLIVEDEPALLLLYQMEFEAEGYQVMTAANAAQTLQRLKAEKADIVILDIGLPGKSGVELLREIVDSRHNLPVIINTAYGFYREDFATWGAEAFLVKSGDLTELKETVARLAGVDNPSPDKKIDAFMVI